VVIGRKSTPHKNSTGKLDLSVDTLADYNAVVGTSMNGTNFDERYPNSLNYETNHINGFKFAIAYIAADVQGEDDLPMTTTESKRSGTSISVTYEDGPLYLAIANEAMDDNGGAGVDEKPPSWVVAGILVRVPRWD